MWKTTWPYTDLRLLLVGLTAFAILAAELQDLWANRGRRRCRRGGRWTSAVVLLAASNGLMLVLMPWPSHCDPLSWRQPAPWIATGAAMLSVVLVPPALSAARSRIRALVKISVCLAVCLVVPVSVRGDSFESASHGEREAREVAFAGQLREVMVEAATW